MPAVKKTTAKKKQSFFARLIPSTKKAKILTTVAAFAVIGGGIMVYRSFAATTTNYTGGVMTWLNDGSRKYTNRVSSNGTVCIEYLAFDLEENTNIFTDRFAVRLFTLVNGKWIQSREYMDKSSRDYNRTNFQRTCYRKLTSAYLYRVQFDPTSDLASFLDPDRAQMRLTYKIHGYDVEKGETSATSKNPNNSEPAPAPVPVSNPKPSK